MVHICRSYRRNKSGIGYFFRHVVLLCTEAHTEVWVVIAWHCFEPSVPETV